MSPQNESQFEAAIAAIQPLSFTERQQLLQILTQANLVETAASFPTDLQRLSMQFWQNISIQELRKTQTSITVDNLQDFVADFWLAEDSVEDFLTFLRQ